MPHNSRCDCYTGAYSHITWTCSCQVGMKVVTVPSVVGTGSTELGLLDLAGVTGRRRRLDPPYHLASEGVEFLVGPGVVDYTRPVERLDLQSLIAAGTPCSESR